ncbi:hypothetical protein [Streptomyces sp. NRRL B-24484]|uniref:hypothetical protein n=1 Tax=Streptomyces sp. NRRL B-24484 TaxID=1463833 RepID=UPI0004C109C4|nr:hypothetical protein [Streptomyces sp. NRRL B-24484]
MGDVWCEWCGTRLPGPAGSRRRFCRAAHRQAAWRARRRWRAAAPARGALEAAEARLLAQLLVIAQRAQQLGQGQPPWWHCAAVAQVPELAGQVVRSAVLADRSAGASWAQIGEGLGISADAARARFGRARRTAGTR